MGSNLNPWYAVLWRRFDQWARRLFFDNFDTPLRRRLYDQKRQIAIKDVLTDAEKAELAHINRRLGNGGVYRFTAEQRCRQAEIAAHAIQRKQ